MGTDSYYRIEVRTSKSAPWQLWMTVLYEPMAHAIAERCRIVDHVQARVLRLPVS